MGTILGLILLGFVPSLAAFRGGFGRIIVAAWVAAAGLWFWISPDVPPGTPDDGSGIGHAIVLAYMLMVGVGSMLGAVVGWFWRGWAQTRPDQR